MEDPGYAPGGVAVGRIVHFRRPDGQGYKPSDRHLAAIITRVYSPTMVSLTVFPDGTNDFDAGGGVASSLNRWESSVPWDPDGDTPRSWHFPETV
jgi:hypothetical protein